MPIRAHGRGWQVRVQVRGRRIVQTVVGTKAQAKAVEARIRSDIAANLAGQRAPHTFADAITRWVKGEATALKSHHDLLNKIAVIQPYITGKTLDQAADVAQAIREAGLKAGLQPATINRRLAILRRVLNLAHDSWGWIDVPYGRRVKMLPGESPRSTRLTPAQVNALMLACDLPAARDAILLAAHTGLRIGELLRLQPSDVVDGVILLGTDTKTGRPRAVPMSPQAAAVRLPIGLTYDQFYDAFERARERASMPDVQPRDLRRTFGSWIVQETGSLKVAQDLLGHASPTITARHYAHLVPGNLRDAINTLPSIGVGQPRAKKKSA